MPLVNIDGSSQPVEIADFGRKDWTKVYLANLSATAMRISTDKQTLASSPNGGLPLLNTDGIVQLDWRGKLWAISAAQGILSWECPTAAQTHN